MCRSMGNRVHSRAVVRLPPGRALEQAAAEVSATLGTLAFSGAALYGLAMSIREANHMDEKDGRLMAAQSMQSAETAQTAQTVQVPETVNSVETVQAPEPVMPKAEASRPLVDQNEIQKRADEARSWIAAWKANTLAAAKASEAAAAEERKRIEAADAQRVALEKAEAAERKAKEAEEKALAAKKAVEAKEAEMAALRASAEAQVAKRAQQAREWITSWKQKTADVDSSPADPAMAAAVIKKMTEDAPVGVQKPVPASAPEPAVVGVSSSPTDDTETQKAPARRVSITAEYQTKIKSLISNYEETKQKQREQAMRMPKEVVTVGTEELEKATKKSNPIVMFCLRIVAMIQACLSYIMSLFTGSGSGSTPATA
jgi:colicin import membrane protein